MTDRPPPDDCGKCFDEGFRMGAEWAKGQACDIAMAIDSKRGNEAEIARAIDELEVKP